MLHNMNKQLNRRLKRLEKFLCDEPEDIEVMENPIETSFDEVFKWLFGNFLPVCSLALIINLAILFTLPVEVVMSRWFWLKDPLSFIFAYIVVKAINHFRN